MYKSVRLLLNRKSIAGAAAIAFTIVAAAIFAPACGDSGAEDADGGVFGTRAVDRHSPPTFDAEAEPTPRTLRGGAERAPERGGTPEAGASGPRRLLPDLQVMPINELYVEGSEESTRILRFSTTVLNAGEGPLELVGRQDPEAEVVIASQRIYLDNGSVVSREVGRFAYHSGHAHWHFADFTVLEIWSLDDDGEPDELVASTGKGTFCAVDEIPEFDDADEPAYFDCGGAVQGISAGWSDTYGAEIMGQELDISHLDDGRYAIRSTVDPDNTLRETDETNNSYTVIVELRSITLDIPDD